jgi:chemotaxis protein MotB
LLAGGLPEDQVLRVQGLAASNPFDRRDPAAPANRRISIIVMTREAEERVFAATPAIEPAAAEPASAEGTPESPGVQVPQSAAAPAPAGSSPPVAHR